MSTTVSTTAPQMTLEAEAERIVASGIEVRRRLTDLVARSAACAQTSGQGLLGMSQSVLEGARQGFEKSVPADPDDVLRQVVDALGDGLSQAALATRLVLEETSGSCRSFMDEDLSRLSDDLQTLRGLFGETVARTLRNARSLTATQVSNVSAHALRVEERLGPMCGAVCDAARQHPLRLGKEGLQAGLSAGRHATGALFQAVGAMLQRTGDRLRRDAKEDGAASS